MEDKEKILITIFGVVALIAVVGVIGIFNKPTYIIISPENFEAEQATKTESNAITGMAVYDLDYGDCENYYNRYNQYGWFNDWDFFKDNCIAKYGDFSVKKVDCQEGFTDYYRCLGDNQYRGWQQWEGDVCKFGLKKVEYCDYGCVDGNCNSKPKPSDVHTISKVADKREPICIPAKWLYTYRCYKGNVQKNYRNTDCTEEYKDFYICEYGCNSKTIKCNDKPIPETSKKTTDTGYALSPPAEQQTPPCPEKFLGGYDDKCIGDYLQRVYQYPSCMKMYRTLKFCGRNKCSVNKCIT